MSLHMKCFIALLTTLARVSIANPLPSQEPYLDSVRNHISPPPKPEPIEITALRLPPVASNSSAGGCNAIVDPHRTGCIGKSTLIQSGTFLPDGKHVLSMIEYVGAPKTPDPASIYDGQQVTVFKADGTTFQNGAGWKCITCGAKDYSTTNASATHDFAYPQAFKDGHRIIAGAYIIDCDGKDLTRQECSPGAASIYPIHLPNNANDTGSGAALRELRLHPDQAHLSFNVFSYAGGVIGQNTFVGRLRFNPDLSRYDLINVNQLSNPNLPSPISTNTTSGELKINSSALTVGELRGFTGTGQEVTYVGYSTESCNIDVYAAHLKTGAVRRLTTHPGYVDPVQFSPDDSSFVIMDTRGSNRIEFMSGMRGIPPISDIITTTACASVRNNGMRRFFQPYLLDAYGDRGDYYGQEINNASTGVPGSGAFNDPEWNGMADPFFSPDGTKIVYWQAQTVSPACGGENPLPCYESKEPGGATARILIAHLTSREPLPEREVEELPDVIPWAVPYVPGGGTGGGSGNFVLDSGNFTLKGKMSGSAAVEIIIGDDADTVKVTFSDFSDDGVYTLHGTQNITRTVEGFTRNTLDWYTDLVRDGPVRSTQISSADGFHMSIDALTNLFEANGTLVTTVGEEVFRQPLDDA